MNVNELIEEYQKLTDREKIFFKNRLKRIEEYDKLKNLKNRVDIAENINKVLVDDLGEPYLGTDYIVNHIIKPEPFDDLEV